MKVAEALQLRADLNRRIAQLGERLNANALVQEGESTPEDPKAHEVYFTDSLTMLAKTKGLQALDFEGVRFDMGNKLGIMKANVEVALQHEEIGEEFKAYIKELAKTL